MGRLSGRLFIIINMSKNKKERTRLAGLTMAALIASKEWSLDCVPEKAVSLTDKLLEALNQEDKDTKEDLPPRVHREAPNVLRFWGENGESVIVEYDPQTNPSGVKEIALKWAELRDPSDVSVPWPVPGEVLDRIILDIYNIENPSEHDV